MGKVPDNPLASVRGKATTILGGIMSQGKPIEKITVGEIMSLSEFGLLSLLAGGCYGRISADQIAAANKCLERHNSVYRYDAREGTVEALR